jgi:hypothetical protein
MRRTNRSPPYVARLHPLISRTARSGSLSRSVVTRQKPSAYWASWRQPELNRPGVFWRLFGLSHAAMAGWSSVA